MTVILFSCVPISQLMKILFLNPQINAQHQIVVNLQKKGIAVLLPSDRDEAWQMLQLHGESVELGVIHREGRTDSQNLDDLPGLKLIERIKSDPSQCDLPLILTTDQWSVAECAQHQESPLGVNAYLQSPFSEKQIFDLIEAVLGQSFDKLPDHELVPLETVTSSERSSPPPPNEESIEMVLEDATPVHAAMESRDSIADPSIRLDHLVTEESFAEMPSGISLSSLEAPVLTLNTNQDLPITLLASSLGDSVEPVLEIQEQILDESQIELAPAIPLTSSPASEVEADDKQVEQEMPYLFNDSKKDSSSIASSLNPSLVFAEPMGDAVVPGGAAQTPDLETLKKYLYLREQDVAVLSSQFKAAQGEHARVEQLLREEKAKNAELAHIANEQKQKLEGFEREKSVALEGLEGQIIELRFEVKAKTDKARLLENQLREAAEEMEQLKARIRSDIRKIRVREKELENRLEIMKKDSEALISARENKITELKRKLDLLEFNMDLLQDQYIREKENLAMLRDRFSKAAQVVKVVGGLLDTKKEGVERVQTAVDPSESEALDRQRRKTS